MYARPHRLARPVRAAVAGSLGLVAALALIASPANARPYSINECSDGDAAVAAPTDWPKVYAQTSVNNCSAPNGTLDAVAAGLQLGTTSNPSVAVGYQWILTSQTPNAKIIYALLYVGADDQTEGTASGITVGATTSSANDATPNLSPITGSGKLTGWPSSTTFEYKNLSTRSLQYLYKCTSNCYFGSATLHLRRALIQLDDPLAPSGITTEASGLLDGTPQRGTRTLTFTAHDADSGVYSVAVKTTPVDDGSAPLLAYAERQHCDYVSPVACDQNPTYHLSIDTTKLPEGTQTLHVALLDAAGNQRWVDLPAITVDNSGSLSGPPGGPTPTPIPTPTTTPGPLGQTPAGSTPAPTLAKLTTTAKKGELRTGYGKKVTLIGHLVDGSGQPIRSATVDVFEQVDAITDSAKTKTGSVTTDANGEFTYVPSTSSSRTVQFAYGPLGNTGGYAQTTSVALHVQAKVTARISTSLARRGQVVKVTGKVFASPLPKRGVGVNVEFWQHGRWRGVEVLHTSQSGTYTWTHRFRVAGIFKIRVTAIGSSDLPAIPGSSGALLLTTH